MSYIFLKFGQTNGVVIDQRSFTQKTITQGGSIRSLSCSCWYNYIHHACLAVHNAYPNNILLRFAICSENHYPEDHIQGGSTRSLSCSCWYNYIHHACLAIHIQPILSRIYLVLVYLGYDSLVAIECLEGYSTNMLFSWLLTQLYCFLFIAIASWGKKQLVSTTSPSQSSVCYKLSSLHWTDSSYSAFSKST